MPGAVAIRRAHLVAQFDAEGRATLRDLLPLRYARGGSDDGLPEHVRAASALRRFDNRLVIVQDDVNALAVRDASGAVRPVLLPAHASGQRVFDDALGNKRDKLDLEACVTLPDGRLVAFGSGSAPQREQLVVWRSAHAAPSVVPAGELYRELRAAVTESRARLNIEGAVVRGGRLELFHRGNDARSPANAIVELACSDFVAWLDGAKVPPRVASVTTVELGAAQGGVPFGFTDAAALDDGRVAVLACAEDTECAVSDGAVLGCRVGMLSDEGLHMVDVYDAQGERTLLKLEGIEPRAASSEFDVAVDVDRAAVPAQLGRLTWEQR